MLTLYNQIHTILADKAEVMGVTLASHRLQTDTWTFKDLPGVMVDAIGGEYDSEIGADSYNDSQWTSNKISDVVIEIYVPFSTPKDYPTARADCFDKLGYILGLIDSRNEPYSSGNNQLSHRYTVGEASINQARVCMAQIFISTVFERNRRFNDRKDYNNLVRV